MHIRPTVISLLNQWLNDEHAAGYGQAKADLKEMAEACGGNLQDAAQAFMEGKTIADAKADHAAALEQRLAEAEERAKAAEAKAKELENGSDEIKTSPDAEITDAGNNAERDAIKAKAGKIENDYARAAYLNSLGYDASEFDFDKD